jgi:hypothetical protein
LHEKEAEFKAAREKLAASDVEIYDAFDRVERFRYIMLAPQMNKVR